MSDIGYAEEIEQSYNRFRQLHLSKNAIEVLADTLYELHFFDQCVTEQQTNDRNYAVRVIEKMGVLTPGDKYEFARDVAILLQKFIPARQEDMSGRE